MNAYAFAVQDQAYSGQAAVHTVAQRFMTSGVDALGR
jgi:hypothetical protein